MNMFVQHHTNTYCLAKTSLKVSISEWTENSYTQKVLQLSLQDNVIIVYLLLVENYAIVTY